MMPDLGKNKGEITTLVLLLGLAVVAIATILTPPSNKQITNTKAAGSCAEIVSVAYSPSPIASGGTMNTTVVVGSAYAGSGSIAVGWMKNGAWPQNGGLWQGATCNGVNCTFTIRMDQYTSGTTDIYELAGYDMTASCGPNTGKKIPLVLQSGQTPTNTPVPPTPTRGSVTLPTATNTPNPTATPLPTSTPRPGVPTPTRGYMPTSIPTNTPILPSSTSIPTKTPIPTASPTKGPDCATIQSVTSSPAKVASGTNFECSVTVDSGHKDNTNIYCTLLKNGLTNLSSAILFRNRCYGTTCNSTLKMDTYSSQTSERYELVAYDGTTGCGQINNGKRTTISINTSSPTNTPSPTPIPPTATPTSRPTLTSTPNPSATYSPLTNTPVPPTVTPTRGFMPTSMLPTATPKPPTATPTPTKLPDCIPLEVNGRNEDKFDLIFLHQGFKNIDDVSVISKKIINNLKASNVKGTVNKFNFYLSSDLNQDYKLFITGTGTRIDTSDFGPLDAMKLKCKGDSVIIIDNLPNEIRATAYVGYNVAMLTAEAWEAAVHELGHSIAGLDDEYDLGTEALPDRIPAVNCNKFGSDSDKPCPGWEKYSDAKCFKICGYTNYYRSTEKSVMNDGWPKPDLFNEIGKEAWENSLKNFN